MKLLYLNVDRGIPVQGDKGASVHVREFITAAAGLGHDVTLACTTLGEGNPLPPARLLHVPAPPADTALRDQLERRERACLAHDDTVAARICAELDQRGWVPDLIYERHALFHRAGVTLAARLGVPRILEVNAPLVEEQRRFRGLLLEADARAAEAASYRGAEAVVAVSGAVGAHVSAVLGGGERVHVVPNGVDLERFGAAGAAGAALRAGLGLADVPVAGFVGSFKSWHGVPFLLDAMAALTPAFPALHLIAVGDGPDHEAVAAKVAKLGLESRVILPGRASHGDIPAWLGAMDFTVAPYLPQPDFYFSPLKIFESLAAGRPVIAPRIGEIDGILRQDADGLLYPPGDLAGLQAALTRFLAYPEQRAAMGAQARASVAARGWRAVVAHCLALAPVECAA
ncbi:glycosyltransferase [Acidocella sp.]|uniref:glycosyltransferase n=1 Tax=Acidocella sp. TaxID=50710 RepID=UPI002611176C|nr:glycosyltransferase [Acidocella sp.]